MDRGRLKKAQLSVKSNLLCFALLCLAIGLKKKLASLCYPIRSKNKTSPKFLRLVFPRFASATRFISSFDWFTGLSASFVIGQCYHFGFGFKTLNWKQLWLALTGFSIQKDYFRLPESNNHTVITQTLLVHHLALVLLSCNPLFLEQEVAPDHSWSTSVV